jgi:hypothetical protein
MFARPFLAAVLAMAASSPALAETCAETIKTFDAALEQSKLSYETKTEAKSLRYAGEIKMVAGDEKQCREMLDKALKIIQVKK